MSRRDLPASGWLRLRCLPLPFSLRPPDRATLSQQLFGLLASLVIGNARLAAVPMRCISPRIWA
jgi:hypothetical protein